MFKIGFIDYYLDEWHANNYPAWIKEASGGEMQVTHAFALIDSPRGGRTTDAWCGDFGVTRCATIQEIVDACDGLVVLSPDNTEMHLTLCEIPLQSGKPVYVDKTFAPDAETARRLFAWAENSGTPCYSSSALRYAEEYAPIDPREVQGVSTWGPNDLDTYSIHQLEPIVMLMQGKPQKVLYVPGKTFGTLNILFEDGRSASMAHYINDCPFVTNVALHDSVKVLPIESNSFKGFIQALVDFFRTGKEQVPHQETISIMALREAALKAAAQPLSWVLV